MRKEKTITIPKPLSPLAKAQALPEKDRPDGWQKLSNVPPTDRDEGKRFLLTEMGAVRAEKWALKALLALSRAGIDIPDDMAALGIRGVAMIGLKGLMGASFYDMEPLLDEMMGCVQIVEQVGPRRLTEDDIEEVGTILMLRKEVLGLHWDFFTAANTPK